jgi:NADP-dependent 3-hydroxy acid dehydrogenase YdfG
MRADIDSKAFAAAFAKAGAKSIILTARKAETLKSTEDLIHQINPSIEVMSAPLEVTNEDSVRRLFEKVGDRFGKVDVLVSNAGIFESYHQRIADGDITKWWNDIVCNAQTEIGYFC